MATGPRLSIRCPHCGEKARVRTSREETPLVRSVNLQCLNLECGHTFAAKLEITHTIAPASRPHPDILLPVTPVSLRRSIGTRLGALQPPANDDGGREVPPAMPDDSGAAAGGAVL